MDRIVVFEMNPDGKVTLRFRPAFSNNFYIKVGPQTQIKTGWPEFLYCVQDTDENVQVTNFDYDPQTSGLFDEYDLFEPTDAVAAS